MSIMRFRNYRRAFMQKANAHGLLNGLTYTLGQTFSALPAALGHFIDTCFKIDGIFIKKNRSHMNGPFGLAFGIIPFFLGSLIGGAAQLALNLPMYLGYYLIDKPIAFLIRRFSKQNKRADFAKTMRGGGIHGKFSSLMAKIYFRYSNATSLPPKQMSGVFGFWLGIIPHAIGYAINRLACAFTSSIQFATDKACYPIHQAYRVKKPQKIHKPNKPRFAINVDINPIAEEELNKTIMQRVNLFEALGITRETYEKDKKSADKAYKSIASTCHPDKANGDAQKIERYTKAQTANQILMDSPRAGRYLAWYSKWSEARSTQTTQSNDNNIPVKAPRAVV